MAKNYSGFTLIELLIVIAIIGILASAIIVSLGDTTEAATDARDKQTLTSLRPLTILYIAGNGTSGSDGMCDQSDSEIRKVLDALVGIRVDGATAGGAVATAAGDGYGSVSKDGILCKDSSNAGLEDKQWVIVMNLKVGSNVFCMDESGSAEVPAADVGPTVEGCSSADETDKDGDALFGT